MTAGAPAQPVQRGFMDKLLDGVERVGNKVPHPVLMFAYLILFIIILSSILGWLGVSVTEEIAVPVPIAAQPNYYEDLSQPSVGLPPVADVTEYEIKTTTIAIRPILSVEGIRWMFTSFVPTFQGFGALAITLIALLGAGAAE
ncbi:MAG: AbgT family transporter, partial [Anaerolineae bacterium]|nr:AbgT family transporter [Anaerolineae bacterium]